MTEPAAWIADILNSRKYRGLNLPEETLRDLLAQELPRHRNPKDAEKAVRQKLHNIIAPYLGDPDYPAARAALDAAFSSGDPGQVQAACLDILQSHASTRERIPHLREFYNCIWQITGQPAVLLDLACGLNPFAWRWMDLPAATACYAYDLHQPRTDLIQHYFQLEGLHGQAVCQDILVHPPVIQADVAFFFKEAHRFEQRQRGCNAPFWQAIAAHWLVISLPASDLAGHHSLAEQHRQLVFANLGATGWPVTEVLVGNEMIFCIEKQGLA